jgi:hypothetical protein
VSLGTENHSQDDGDRNRGEAEKRRETVTTGIQGRGAKVAPKKLLFRSHPPGPSLAATTSDASSTAIAFIISTSGKLGNILPNQRTTPVGSNVRALHGNGITAVVHHLGWVDRGEPAVRPEAARDRVKTYVPGAERSGTRTPSHSPATSIRLHTRISIAPCPFWTIAFDADGWVL